MLDRNIVIDADAATSVMSDTFAFTNEGMPVKAVKTAKVDYCANSAAKAAACSALTVAIAANDANDANAMGGFPHIAEVAAAAAYNAAYAFAAAAYVISSQSKKPPNSPKDYNAINASAAREVVVAAYHADLLYLKSGVDVHWPQLWQGQQPRNWNFLLKNFILGLNTIRLEYWSEEYQNWVTGKFDAEKLERCLFVPDATLKAGPMATMAYLKAEKLVNMAEARVVFLGEGAAGKTSLIRCLFGEKPRRDEPATPRIDIRQRLELIKGNETRVHYWDFGGQVIMHATHQFFLREKSVYVVVLDIRRCDSLEYWLDHVRVFASGAPTLLVLNKIDNIPTGLATLPPFDLKRIRRRYPFVVDAVFSMSCRTAEGVEVFAASLQENITQSHILKADMPEKWFQVKEELAKENKDFISSDRFNGICHSLGVIGEEIPTTLSVLDILGVAIHFPKLPHNDVVLNPEWITKAIYFIIWANEKQHFSGKLDAATLISLFTEARANQELEVGVPDEKCTFLLDLMTEFKLAFRSSVRDGVYCVPMLAPTDEPPHNVQREGGLQFIFSLPFLPPGLFYRFIAESGDELDDDLLWKSGAVLTHEGNRALVEYSDYHRSITFIAHGPNAGKYLTRLRQKLMQILGESYKDLAYSPYIIKHDGEQIDWRDMFERFAREKGGAKAYAGGNEYKVIELIQEYFGDVLENILQSIKSEMAMLFEKNKGVQVMINNINNSENINTVNPDINIEQTQNNTATITINNEVKCLLDVDSDLKIIKEILEDFKEDEKAKAAENEKELSQLIRNIDRLRQDISELKALPETADAEKTSTLRRIKERWDTFSDKAKQFYYVTGMAEKITKAAIGIHTIDWNKWFS